MNNSKGDDRLSLRLGPLREPLLAAAEEMGVNPSEYIRRVLAENLGLPVPDIVHGKMDISKHAAEGGRAVWAKKKKKTKKRKQ